MIPPIESPSLPDSPASEPLSGRDVVLDALVRQGFMPIFAQDRFESRVLVEGAIAAGCKVLEYTCRRPDAREIIPWIKKEFPGVAVLAATLVDSPRLSAHLQETVPGFVTVDEAVDLGADGLVSFMGFRTETYAKYGSRTVIVPGVTTANEAVDQLERGADLIKTIVGSTGGRELLIRSRVPSHSGIPYLVSGGVNQGNVESYIQAGAVAATAGVDLLIGPGQFTREALFRRTSEVVIEMLAAVRAAREKHQPHLAQGIQDGARDLLSTGPWYWKRPAD